MKRQLRVGDRLALHSWGSTHVGLRARQAPIGRKDRALLNRLASIVSPHIDLGRVSVGGLFSFKRSVRPCERAPR
jgi:hypothetical protein